jgi:hypothetical protein
MSTEVNLPPETIAITETLRAHGYNLNIAISDIIDNSISANSSKIDIFYKDSIPALVIIDNGDGIDEGRLMEAMKFGSRDPAKKRSESDLGRFGLGLKTASFSQCRKFTLVSSVDGKRSGCTWNLNTIRKKNDYIALKLDDREINNLPYIDKLDKTGTIVIWEDMDRIGEGSIGPKLTAIMKKKLGVDLRDHLSLVFHMYLCGEVNDREKLSISIMGNEIEGINPFFTKNKATMVGNPEKIRINGSEVWITDYTIPRKDNLPSDQKKLYNNYYDDQGFYIYRNNRIIKSKDWCGILKKEDNYKYARVRIDYPSSLDSEFKIDVKKSSVELPKLIRDRLKNTKDTFLKKSSGLNKQKVDENKQSKMKNIDQPIWNVIEHSDGKFYTLNVRFKDLLELKNTITTKDFNLLKEYLKKVIIPLSRVPIEKDTELLDKTSNLDSITDNKL